MDTNENFLAKTWKEYLEMQKEIMKKETKQQDRIRINVSTSVKGIKTYDCTVEVHGNMDRALSMSDMLIAELDKRYPAGGGLNE